jgi:hypothetical protein
MENEGERANDLELCCKLLLLLFLIEYALIGASNRLVVLLV